MALFKSNEQKEAEKQQKVEEMMKKYGLEDLSDPRDIESVKKIVSDLAGSGLSQIGAMLTGDDVKVNVRILVQYQQAILEQNFMLIRLLDRLSKH